MSSIQQTQRDAEDKEQTIVENILAKSKGFRLSPAEVEFLQDQHQNFVACALEGIGDLYLRCLRAMFFRFYPFNLRWLVDEMPPGEREVWEDVSGLTDSAVSALQQEKFLHVVSFMVGRLDGCQGIGISFILRDSSPPTYSASNGDRDGEYGMDDDDDSSDEANFDDAGDIDNTGVRLDAPHGSYTSVPTKRTNTLNIQQSPVPAPTQEECEPSGASEENNATFIPRKSSRLAQKERRVYGSM